MTYPAPGLAVHTRPLHGFGPQQAPMVPDPTACFVPEWIHMVQAQPTAPLWSSCLGSHYWYCSPWHCTLDSHPWTSHWQPLWPFPAPIQCWDPQPWPGPYPISIHSLLPSEFTSPVLPWAQPSTNYPTWAVPIPCSWFQQNHCLWLWSLWWWWQW